jgi:hypothetical protein
VIAADVQGGVRAEQCDDFIRRSAVAHHIAEVPELIHAGSGAKHSFERVNVAMDVGDDERTHGAKNQSISGGRAAAPLALTG